MSARMPPLDRSEVRGNGTPLVPTLKDGQQRGGFALRRVSEEEGVVVPASDHENADHESGSFREAGLALMSLTLAQMVGGTQVLL